jgi:hypothetical protein
MSHIKSGWSGTGKIRMGKGTELKRKPAEAIEHPEKNPQLSGTPKPLNGFHGKKK